MNINNINTITLSQYGFRVFNWDDNRGCKDGAGKILLGKVNFRKSGWEDILHGTASAREINELAFTIAQRDLEGMTDQSIAHLFHRIIKTFENVEIEDNKYWPMSIHMKGSVKPFLFILGDKAQPVSPQSINSR